MSNFKLPLAGDVSQMWSTAYKNIGNQFGLINVVVGRTSDSELEEEILEEVGSYGRQIGHIAEALRVLLDNIKIEKLDQKEKRAIRMFKNQMDEIESIREKRRSKKDD
ncbi:MAG: hypothetical protein PHX43_01605 [Alphaproteobacteria bacterium]|nr:hypothetical protein [Alphaproteobacteria bacterium]